MEREQITAKEKEFLLVLRSHNKNKTAKNRALNNLVDDLVRLLAAEKSSDMRDIFNSIEKAANQALDFGLKIDLIYEQLIPPSSSYFNREQPKKLSKYCLRQI